MRIAVINPPKLFNSYETFLMIGTVSYCPDGNWLSVQDLSIAEMLRRLGHEVCYIDGDNRNLDLVQTAREAIDFNPDFVIMNTETIDYARSPLSSFENVNIISEIIKAVLPKCKIAIYGTHVAIDTTSISEKIDYKIKGEPEGVIIDLVEEKAVDLNKIYHVENLDVIPPPAYDLAENVPKNPSEYAAKALVKEKFTQVAWERGCPYPCIFCCRAGLGTKYRAKWNIKEELEALEKNGYGAFYIIDDTFGNDEKWLMHFLDCVEQFNFKWCVQTRVDIVRNKRLLKRMTKAGCVQVGLGVESFDDFILKKIGKLTNTKLIREAFESARNASVDVVAFLMLGLPGETQEVRDKTDKFISEYEDILVGAGPFLITPYPLTKLWTDAQIMSLDVRECLRFAGLFGDWSNIYEAREEWIKYDKKWGFGADVLSMIKKYRPLVYSRWEKYIKSLGGKFCY